MIERHFITDRATWLALRAQDLTASDIGAAAGLDHFKTPLALYAEKTGQLVVSDNNLMRRGRWLEAAVLEAIRDEHPTWEVRKSSLYLRDPDLRLGATPDAFVWDDHGIMTNCQCKVVSKPSYERYWSDGPPMAYVLQCLTECMLSDAPQGMLAALVVDTYSADLFLHPVPRHEAAEARVRAIAANWHQRLAAGLPPPADYARDAETVAALWPNSQADPVLDLTGDNRLADLLPARAMLKAEIADLGEQVEALDTEIRVKLGAAEKAVLPGWRISCKTVNRNEYTVPASTYRQLRITDKRDNA